MELRNGLSANGTEVIFQSKQSPINEKQKWKIGLANSDGWVKISYALNHSLFLTAHKLDEKVTVEEIGKNTAQCTGQEYYISIFVFVFVNIHCRYSKAVSRHTKGKNFVIFISRICLLNLKENAF